MYSVILVLSLCVLRAFAVVPQDDWTSPQNNANNPTILTAGQSFTIQWDGNLTQWFPAYSPNTSVTSADLWITGYDLHQYQYLVASSVNVRDTRLVTWKVNLPTDEVDEVGTWVFRFIQSGIMPSQTKYEISSASCIIKANPSSVTTTKSPTTTSSTSSSTASGTTTGAINRTTGSTTTTGSVTTTTGTTAAVSASVSSSNTSSGAANPTPPSTSSGGLSTGAKAGIAVGAVLGAILLIGAGWFLARRKPSRRDTRDELATPAAVAAGHPSRSHREEKQFTDHNQQPVPPYSNNTYQHQAYSDNPPYQGLHTDAPQTW